MSRLSGPEESMRVLVRVRPPDNELEGITASSSSFNNFTSLVIDETETKISLNRDKNKGTAEFSFSHVLNMNSNQNDLFLLCKDLINDVTDGINCAILAYGQTGSGKTYSMLGQGWEDVLPNELNDDGIIQHHEGFGLIPRCVAELFEWIKKRSTDESFDYSINCQYIQIYNEKIFDLLQDRKRQNPLQLRDADRGSNCSVYVQGLSQYLVHSLDDVLQLLINGMRNRAIRATELNNESSRSHTILQLYLQFHGQDSSGFSTLTRSTLSFVDLAGSEKWRPSLTTASSQSDQQIREMTNINTSLHVLGNCVSALIESGRKHIPFRDSILTRLLQDSLGGGKTTLIATVRSDESMRDETYSTLQFASRASKIKTILRPLAKLFANQSNPSNGESMTLEQAKKEIAILRARVQSLENQSLQTQLPPSSSSSSDVRTITVPTLRQQLPIDNSLRDVDDIEISLHDSCPGCVELEKILFRYLTIIQQNSTTLASLSDEESAGWGYSSTEEENRRQVMVEEDESNQRKSKENLQKIRETPLKSGKLKSNTSSIASANQVYGGQVKKKRQKKKIQHQTLESDSGKKQQLTSSSNSNNSSSIPSPIQTTSVEEQPSPLKSAMKLFPTDSPAIKQTAEYRSSFADSNVQLNDTSVTSPVPLKNPNSLLSARPPVQSIPQAKLSEGPSFSNQIGLSRPAEFSLSQSSNLFSSSSMPSTLVSSTLNPIPTASSSTTSSATTGPCQKHGLQACVLCSMFTSSIIYQSKPQLSQQLPQQSSMIAQPSYQPSSSYLPSPQPPPPLVQISKSSNSSTLCPIHFVTNCLLCTLKSNQPSPYRGTTTTSSLPSSLQFSNSFLTPLPTTTASSSMPSLPLQAMATTASSSSLPSSIPSITPQVPPVESNSDWDRMLRSTGIKYDQSPLVKSSPILQPMTLQPLTQVPTTNSYNPPPTNSYLMSSLSSADSAFGFTPTQQNSHSNTTSTISPRPIPSTRPPSHHQRHHPLRTPPIHSSSSISQSDTSISPSTHTPTHSNSEKSHQPDHPIPQIYKKGIVFEDENDDITATVHDMRKRSNHRRYNFLNNQQQDILEVEEKEVEEGLKSHHSSRSTSTSTQQGNSSPTGKKKQSNKEIGKKLIRLPNGALVKRRDK